MVPLGSVDVKSPQLLSYMVINVICNHVHIVLGFGLRLVRIRISAKLMLPSCAGLCLGTHITAQHRDLWFAFLLEMPSRTF